MTPDPDDFRRRAIRAALTVAGIAVVIGLVIGGITASVLNLTGLVPEDRPSPTLPAPDVDDEDDLPTPSLLPSDAPSPRATPSPSSTRTAGVSRTSSPPPSRSPHHRRKHRHAAPIRLHASADSVSAYEEVTLSGGYPGADGTTLQVQRLEGGTWASFPTSATVDGGRFSTYVASGQQGVNRFRVVDPSTGESSNVVVFTVS